MGRLMPMASKMLGKSRGMRKGRAGQKNVVRGGRSKGARQMTPARLYSPLRGPGF